MAFKSITMRLAVLWMVLLPVLMRAQLPHMQPNYAGSYDPATWVDNIANLVVTNGWSTHPNATGTNITYSQGKVIVTTSGGCASVYSDDAKGGTNGWTTIAGVSCGLFQPQYSGDGNLYYLKGNLSGACAGAHNLYRWNGTTETLLGGSTYCYKRFSVAADGEGMFILIDNNNHGWRSYNNGTTQSIIGVVNMLDVTAVSSTLGAGTFAEVQTNNAILVYNGSSFVARPGIAAKNITANQWDGVYALGTDGCDYHLNGSLGWDKFAGCSIQSIAYGGPIDVWAVATGGTVKRAAEQTLKYTRRLTGTTTCIGAPCPTKDLNGNPITHTARVQAQIHDHGTAFLGPITSITVPPTQQVAIASSVVLENPFNCFGDPTGCGTDEPVEDVTCTVQGQLMNDGGMGGPVPHFEVAWSRMIATNNPNCATSMDAMTRQCNYPVAQYCTNHTPDYDPLYVSGRHDDDIEFDVHSFCWSFNHEPWSCLDPTSTEADFEYTLDIGQKACTNDVP